MYLQNTTQTDLHFGSAVHYKKDTKESGIDREFYSQLPKKLIKQLYDTIYEVDFQMLGYEYPQEYINMGHDDDVE